MTLQHLAREDIKKMHLQVKTMECICPYWWKSALLPFGRSEARAKTQLFRVPVGVSMSLQNIFLNNQVFVRWKPLVLWFWKTPGHYNGSIIGNQLILKTGPPIYTLFCLFPHEYLCAIILTGLSNFYVDIGFWPMGLGSAEMQHSCLATQTHQFIGGDEYFLRNIFFSLFLNG